MHKRIPLAIVGLAVTLCLSCSRTNAPEPNELEPSYRVSIDSVTALNGEYTTLALNISRLNEAHPLDSMSSFDIFLAYDAPMIVFLDASQGNAISEWEYFTWRHIPPNSTSRQGTVRLKGHRKVSDGDEFPRQILPEGELARLRFVVTSDRDKVGREPEITYRSRECTDNTIIDGGDSNHLLIAREFLPSSSVWEMFDTLNCPKRYTLSPEITFVSGAVKILEPPVDRNPLVMVTLGSVGGDAGDTVEADIAVAYHPLPPGATLTFGGFDLLVAYDSSALKLQEVLPGERLTGWEFFTWRKRIPSGASGNASNGVRIISLRDLEDETASAGNSHPIGTIAKLRFELTRDIDDSLSCKSISFHSEDVWDNLFADSESNLFFIAIPRQVGMGFGLGYDSTECDHVETQCQKIVGFRQENCVTVR